MRWYFLAIVLFSSIANAQFLFGPDEEVEETFEQATVFSIPIGDLPTWVAGFDAGTVSVTELAAHRGDKGLRLSSAARPDGGERTGPFVGLYREPQSLLSPSTPLYFRAWVRINASPSESRLLFFTFANESGIGISRTADRLGWQVGHTGETPVLRNQLSPFVWSLLEWEYTREHLPDGGTGGGTVRLWLDGRLHRVQPQAILTTRPNTLGLSEIYFGLVEHYQRDWPGTVDVDDIRRSRSPPASTLTISPIAPGPACPTARTFRVGLRASEAMPDASILAPDEVVLEAALSVSPDAGVMLRPLVARCPTSGRAVIAKGAAFVDVGFEPGTSADGISLVVRSTDYLSATTSIEPFDADAGPGGAPVKPPAFLGCAQVSPGAGLWMALLVLVVGRKR